MLRSLNATTRGTFVSQYAIDLAHNASITFAGADAGRGEPSIAL
jgi:hypothetical protein